MLISIIFAVCRYQKILRRRFPEVLLYNNVLSFDKITAENGRGCFVSSVQFKRKTSVNTEEISKKNFNNDWPSDEQNGEADRFRASLAKLQI